MGVRKREATDRERRTDKIKNKENQKLRRGQMRRSEKNCIFRKSHRC